jgi:2-polyprenyl-6-methoxyphenol hydroxylase-like FAD-dependent oxidoreductase
VSARPLHVLVIGGGIGGLTLAHGLRQAGVSVAVFERDRTKTDWLQGYRIHINPGGSRALHACLPPALWDAFIATAGQPSDGFGFLTDQLRELVVIEPPRAPVDPVAGHHPVSRSTLRQVLLAGLDDAVSFGKQFVRYAQAADGQITAFFADGTSATGDVLVGADGVGSRVRQQYLPHARVVDTGVAALVGKLWLTDAHRAWLPRQLVTRPNNILPPSGAGMFTAEFIHKTGGAQALAADGPDYLFWAFVAPRTSYGVDGELRRLDGAALQRLALAMIEGWHPHLRRLVAESDPHTVASLPIQTSVPIEPWVATNVTLLGDAIHTMTPLQGIGGNTALRDAALLCHKLVEVERGQAELLPAIGQYEAEMRAYGFEAVRASLQTAQYAVSDNVLLRTVFKMILRVADAVPPVKHRLFQSMAS